MANNKNEEKFKFITLGENDEIIEDNSLLEDNNMSFEEIKESEFANKSLKDLVDASLKKPRVIPSPEELDKREEYKAKKGIYVSFETRVAIRIICMLILFSIACYFILEAVNYGKKELINYNEITEVNYHVCERNSDYYVNSNCQDEGLKYNKSKANFINVLFKYNADYSKEVAYDIDYHVVAITRVFDEINNTKEVYKNEDILVERTSLSDISDKIFFDSSSTIEYKKYNDLAMSKANEYGSSCEASLEIVLYMDKDDKTEDVASITMPLMEDKFGIRKSELSNLNQTMEFDNNVWNDYNSICALIASILIVISLTILYRTTKLVLKVTNNKSTYEKILVKLLSDYDDEIVVAKDGYEVESYKKVIKVDDFKELLDARKLLNKPIIYSKINSIKSEFIVEDESKVFKFVLKDSDL